MTWRRWLQRPSLAAALARLRAGERCTAREWRALAGSDDPAVYTAMLAAVTAWRDLYRRRDAVRWLVAAAGHAAGLACFSQPAAARQLVHLLRDIFADWFRECESYALGRHGQDIAPPYSSAVWPGFVKHAGQLLERLGPAGLDAAREVLDGPPQPVIVGYVAADSAAWTDVNAERAAGIKTLCLRLLQRHPQHTDTARCERLCRDPRESAWVRVEAGLAWHQTAGPEVLPEILAICADPDLEDLDTFPAFARRVAGLGPAAAPHAAELMHGDDFNTRHRAAAILAQLGEAGAAELGRLVRNAEDWRVRQIAANFWAGWIDGRCGRR